MNEVSFQNGLQGLNGNVPKHATKTDKTQHPESFSDLLTRSLDDVNQLKVEADEAVENLVAGKQKDIHATMIALEKADVAFQLLMQVRNKIISAYETIMRMQA
jgi:flagellar hook-basal body complex protein FliE